MSVSFLALAGLVVSRVWLFVAGTNWLLMNSPVWTIVGQRVILEQYVVNNTIYRLPLEAGQYYLCHFAFLQ